MPGHIGKKRASGERDDQKGIPSRVNDSDKDEPQRKLSQGNVERFRLSEEKSTEFENIKEMRRSATSLFFFSRNTCGTFFVSTSTICY